MREDLLHFIWKYKKLQLAKLATTKGEAVSVVEVGAHNLLAGPDFFNAKLYIDDQLWAGNVEIHLKSSDWYAHHHEKDANYNNVILHVVWEDDCAVFRSDNSAIPTLQLRDFIHEELLTAYQNLFDKSQKTFINCQNDIAQVDAFLKKSWLERLYIERLERKSIVISELLKTTKNDWEQVLFVLLAKNFGLKVNGEAFYGLAHRLNFSMVRKLDQQQLESVFFGMAHLLEGTAVLDVYYQQLKKEFGYLKNKFQLVNDGIPKPEFFKLRPPNFPTVRLSQLADVYSTHRNLFHQVMSVKNVDGLYALFDAKASVYWNTHFTFGKESKKSIKKLTKRFVDLLIINTILPLRFCYARHHGKDANDVILEIVSSIPSEKNTVIDNFHVLGVSAESASESQALLQLYNEYCTKNKCLQCAIGSSLLR